MRVMNCVYHPSDLWHKIPMSLNDQQTLFAHEYVKDFNATQAYIRAGYSEEGAGQSGSRLLKNAEVNDLVRKLYQEKLLTLANDKDFVLKTIVDTIQKCSQAAPVYDRNGNPVMVQKADGEIVPAYAFDSRGVLKGTELLAKFHKLLTDKIEASGPNGSAIPVRIIDDVG